jgi:uridine kinase
VSPFLLVLNGISGSGKTTLAEALHACFESALLFLDNYYFPSDPALLAQANMDRPEAIDGAALARDLGALKSGRVVRSPVYGFNQCRPVAEQEVLPAPLLIVEGQYCSAYPEIRAIADATILLEVPYSACLRRRQRRDAEMLGRDPEATRARFESQVVPGFERCLPDLRAAADLVLRPEPGYFERCPPEEGLAWGNAGWEAILALIPDESLRPWPHSPSVAVHRLA